MLTCIRGVSRNCFGSNLGGMITKKKGFSKTFLGKIFGNFVQQLSIVRFEAVYSKYFVDFKLDSQLLKFKFKNNFIVQIIVQNIH